MRKLAEGMWFAASLLIGRALRSAPYSTTAVVDSGGTSFVLKRRSAIAPMLVGLASLLYRLLDTGVRVLPQRTWVKREHAMYAALYGLEADCTDDGALSLPRLRGRTLAAILTDGQTDDAMRAHAVELAVGALADLHGRGFTHADAMADNVMLDLDAAVARWFDFENAHDAARAVEWQRADDLRALLSTVLLHTPRHAHERMLHHVLRSYGDSAVTQTAMTSYRSVLRRALPFHLGQAPISYEAFRAISSFQL